MMTMETLWPFIVWTVIIVGPVVIIKSLISFSSAKAKKKEEAFELVLSSKGFSPDYISNSRVISIESTTKRIMLKSGNDYKVYSPEDVSAWHTGYNTVTSINNSIYYKYYIEFRVKDLDNPNPRVWFGGASQERDKWYARITTLYND